MPHQDFGNIRPVTPSDTASIPSFSYIQAGVSGSIVIVSTAGVQRTISSALLDKIALVPVGTAEKVLATGTTASDIYVWS